MYKGLAPRMHFLGGSVVKNPPVNARDLGLIPGSEKIPWRRKWQPIPVCLPGKLHRQRSLEGYSPRGCKRVRRDLVTKQQPLCISSTVGNGKIGKVAGNWLDSMAYSCTKMLSNHENLQPESR